MTVLIFANGELADTAWLSPYLAGAEVVIAANGGTRHLLAMGYLPDVVIGDLDSISEKERAELLAAGTNFVTYGADKDETDLELALDYAVHQYAGEILIIGALGGRLDQTVATVLLLAQLELHGGRAQIIEDGQRAWVVKESTQIQGAPGDTVSLLPLGGDVHVRETSGLRWELRDEILSWSRSRGVSNMMTARVATVSVERGRLLCIHARQGKQGR